MPACCRRAVVCAGAARLGSKARVMPSDAMTKRKNCGVGRSAKPPMGKSEGDAVAGIGTSRSVNAMALALRQSPMAVKSRAKHSVRRSTGIFLSPVAIASRDRSGQRKPQLSRDNRRHAQPWHDRTGTICAWRHVRQMRCYQLTEEPLRAALAFPSRVAKALWV